MKPPRSDNTLWNVTGSLGLIMQPPTHTNQKYVLDVKA